MSDSLSPRQQIETLVTTFQQKYETRYRKPDYGESNVRSEFIDPLFTALGWTMTDSVEVYREARQKEKVEQRAQDAVKTGRPDYEFLPNTSTRFYVEAKQPSVNLRDDNRPAYQIRSYGWSADMSVCVLTDFEELAIYNTRIRPNKDDKADYALLRRYTYTDYLTKWDEIDNLLSKKAVQQGALIHLVEEAKTGGSVRVDEAFLKDMEIWRRRLAEDLYLHNPELNKRELNLMVQLLLDRLIFLRMCEDRGIERFGQLAEAKTSKDIYAQLLNLFRQADNLYNSGLFHFGEEKDRGSHPDTQSVKLIIPNETLKPILENLYFPRSPYNFDVMPTEILGQAYERFLGKVIEIQGTTITIEEKPDVRKAGGVYYTPAYIVEAIVRNTVGAWLKDKTLTQAETLRILDPACGSGSFLIGAYQYLMTWYADQYRQNSERALDAGNLRLGTLPGTTFLTIAAKKRILTHHLYGVDLDQQAVEVTKLSLLLKLLEGENKETADASKPKQMTLHGLEGRVLPDLDRNIQWGNSLIASDFYSDKTMPNFGEEDLNLIKVFEWGQAFKPIMDRGGFDVVIGNPPYIRLQTLKETAPDTLPYLKMRYQTTQRGNYDLYIPFVEKGLQLLNASGRLGYILPHKFFNAQYGEPLRGLVAQGKHLADVVHFGDIQIFKGATTYTCLLFLDKTARETFRFQKVTDLATWRAGVNESRNSTSNFTASSVTAKAWNFSLGNNDAFNKLVGMPIKLGQIADRLSQGIRTSANDIYVLDLLEEQDDYYLAKTKDGVVVKIEKGVATRFLQGRDIRPYDILPSAKIVILPYQFQGQRASLIDAQTMTEHYPSAFTYLQSHRETLENREKGKMRHARWYGYVYPKNIEVMQTRKLLIPDIANRASFALDEKGQYAFTSGYAITLKPTTLESLHYVLGLLNSSLLDFYLKRISTTMRGGYFRYFTQYIENLPIHPIDFTNPAEKAAHDRIVAHVETLLKLVPQQAALSGEALRIIRSQITTSQTAIDEEVYALYGITQAERAVIEASSLP